MPDDGERRVHFRSKIRGKRSVRWRACCRQGLVCPQHNHERSARSTTPNSDIASELRHIGCVDHFGVHRIVFVPTAVSDDSSGAGGSAGVDVAAETSAPSHRIPLFRGRARAKEFAAQLDELRARTDKLGLLSLAELEERRMALEAETATLAKDLERQRRDAAEAVERETAAAEVKAEAHVTKLRGEEQSLATEITRLRREVIVTEETSLLQEVGIYEYRHPLSDAVAYQAELKRLRDAIKVMCLKDGGAVLASTDWTVNGSRPKGRAMVRDYSKLVLRAYNAEADNLVRGLKPYKLNSAIERLSRIAVTISRLGKTMNIRISDQYHALRVKELELTADYLEKREEEKERERAERERLKEERRVQEELARERARLEKEHEHYSNVIKRLIEQGNDAAASEHRARVEEIEQAIRDVDYRVANVRAGYVYVISNIGAFGERMVKIGLTRRLDPTERVRELGDASVPFRYDTHALFFSDDAVGLEAKMHARLAGRRVNWVNRRREFFYITPQEAKQHLLELAGELLEYTDEPEALEYRQSLNQATAQEGSSNEAPSRSQFAAQLSAEDTTDQLVRLDP